MGDSANTLLEQAAQAAAAGDWSQAHHCFSRARDEGEVAPRVLLQAAEVAYAAGHLDATIETLEEAHARALRDRDATTAAAAAVRVAMHLLFDTALMAPVRGWLARGERLLGASDPGPVHAWLEVVRSYERLLSGDLDAATAHAGAAVEIGSRFDPAAAAIGRVAHARCQILHGDLEDGLKALNEAGVAVLSGELDALSTGVVYCELVCALQGVAQFDLAEEWTRSMERWADKNAIGSLRGRCRVHRAEILRLRGSCEEAEEEALHACDELRPYLRRELGWPLTELGRIRLHLGALDEAEEAFTAAHEVGWDARDGLALVKYARGQVEEAARSIRLALDEPMSIPSKELPPSSELRRAPLLGAAVPIEIAAGNLDRAERATEELEQIAARFASKPLIAAASEALGRVHFAHDRLRDARSQLEHAMVLWDEIGAPYESARVRTALSEVLRREGNDDLATLQDEAARAKLAGLRPASVRPASVPSPAPRPSTSSGDCRFICRGDSWDIDFADRTVRAPDRKGLRYLVHLLGAPGREVHVLELVARENPVAPQAGSRGAAREDGTPSLGDAGELLDERAKEAYRRRLAEIEADLEDATERADLGRIAQVQSEREFLRRELSRAVGLGGRDRRASSASERARVSVTRAIRKAIQQLREHHPELAEHFDVTIRTGTSCSYRPDPRAQIDWRFD